MLVHEELGDWRRGRTLELVRMRGVTEGLVRTPEIEKALRDDGASDALLALIPEPPPPPQPKKAGDLTVECAPRDCEVVVDSRYQGPTEKGRRQIAGLPVGDVEVTVFSDGYDRASKPIKLEENKSAEAVFTLQPSPNTRVELGAKFALETVNALGGLIAAAELSPAVSGTLDITTPAGTAKYMVRYTRTASGGTVELTGQNVSCPVVVSREGVQSQCKKKPRGDISEALEQAAKMIWDHDLAVVLDRALSGKITAQAWLDARRLTSVSPAANMVLQINADHLPVEIDIQPKQGSVEKVTYSEYAIAGKSKYPRKTVVQKDKTVATIQFH